MRGIICLLFTFQLASAAAGAQTPRPGQRSPTTRLEQNLKRLDLTPEQRQKVQAILDASRKEREPLQTQIQETFKKLRGMLEQPLPDEAAVLQQAEKLGALQTQQRKLTLRTQLKVRSELTAEQRQQLVKMRPRGAPDGGAGAKTKPPAATPAPHTP
jgi:Spy/CpxP family protein refolding chaperone